jgi:eukaryotic translation initiation factor 2C
MNAKLGSVNHVVVESVDFPGSFGHLDAPVMMLGADVSHPPPGSSKLWNGKDVSPPSYVGVTASLDRTGMPYMMHVEAQKREGKKAAEVIQNLEEIVKKFISHFQNRARMFPSKIVYFRDGVSDSQFKDILKEEMLAIRKACESYGEGLKPQITFVVVQKRHRTRFFTPDPSKPSVEGEVINPPSGTVVDEDIVSSGTTDFYLISHKGELGTSRPTRYQVLWDDSGFSMNQIETLAYYLCFMYARCNRAVKVPAPTYYAHWAAKRAEALCQGWAHKYYSDLPKLNNLLRKREELDCAKEYPMHFI